MDRTLVVDSTALPWENGLDYLRTLTPAFRDNLGPPEAVEENFRLYWQKSLFLDPVTTRRFDLVRLEPGYRDLTHCCHDSVEEGFVLDGATMLDGEGLHEAGHYFWRPPGWIHHASSPRGVELLLGFEGRCEESGPVTRRVCAAALAGNHATLNADDARAAGPRGRLRRVASGGLPWIDGVSFARDEGLAADFDAEHCAVRILSRNPLNGRQTLLMRLDPGYRQRGRGAHDARLQFFVLAGSAALGERPLPSGTFVNRPALATDGPMSSAEGALLYAKSDGPLTFRAPGDSGDGGP